MSRRQRFYWGKRLSQRNRHKRKKKCDNKLVLNRQLGLERLEDRRLLAGVTIITHGFSLTGNFPQNWMESMGQAILYRADDQTNTSTGSIFKHNPTTGNWDALGDQVWHNSNL